MSEDPLKVLYKLEGDVGPGFPLILYPKGRARLRATVEAQAGHIARLEAERRELVELLEEYLLVANRWEQEAHDQKVEEALAKIDAQEKDDERTL